LPGADYPRPATALAQAARASPVPRSCPKGRFAIRRSGRYTSANFHGDDDFAASTAETNGRDGRIRPPSDDQFAADGPPGRAAGAPALSAPVGPRHETGGLLRFDRCPEAPPGRDPRARLLLRGEGCGALPRQQLLPAGRRRRRLSADPVRDPHVPAVEPPAGRRDPL